MSVRTLSWLEDENSRDLARWAGAGAIVLAIHAGAISYLLSRPAPEEIGTDTDVVTVELAPIDTTPDAVVRDVAPAPETMVESKPVPQPQPQQKPPDEVKIEQPPDADAILPEPAVKPPEKTEEARPPAPRTAEKVKGGALRVEPSWQTSLVRQIQRYKRYPPQAQARNEQGVVLLGFSLDRDGHVLAHHIVQSSGYSDLDNEVMEMIIRAEPLPPFPASMPQSRLDLTVPIRFSLQ
jgi:periplasmic protein TonB